MRATVYCATSLDGFIAREDGGIDWLPTSEGTGEQEDYGYQAFFASVDALVMGRNTYELVRGFGAWPYGDKRVVVLTNRHLELSPEQAETVEVMAGPPLEIVDRLAARGATHLYVDGGKAVQGFLAAGLIDRLILTRVPILLGRGIPLFGPLPHDLAWEHVGTRSFANGLVQSEYRRLGSEPSA
jgi:dihydrofolate reductase